ncbi:unnamed protein product [Fusarium graminearum]|uniref:Uncharacterized protein n=1 Tax=Gibberella zeae TaxID=5518 RepID=A0A4U9EU47_GIBZA|nr:unnamed protein product [Fusarium graminearum]CAG2006271.1 unnamed protein product [Fusarium graminearum]VTO85896.1 unnamed protein product [Fusarium graminearum]
MLLSLGVASSDANCELSSGANNNSSQRYLISERPTAPLQRGAIAIIFIMTALSVLVWAVRIYSRLSKKQVSLDDWLVAVVTVWKPLS